MSTDIRQATCIANVNAKCLTLLREDFTRRLGNPQDLLDVPPARRLRSNIAAPATTTPGRQTMAGLAPRMRSSWKTSRSAIGRTPGVRP